VNINGVHLFTVVLFGRRSPDDALLATAAIAVGKCGKPVVVAVTSSPPELFAAVGRRVEVERYLVLVARTDVGTQLAQVYNVDHTTDTPASYNVLYTVKISVYPPIICGEFSKPTSDALNDLKYTRAN